MSCVPVGDVKNERRTKIYDSVGRLLTSFNIAETTNNIIHILTCVFNVLRFFQILKYIQ